MLEQLTKKAFALFVFDFKYPILSQYVYDQFQQNRHRYPAATQFGCINFTDLSRSHRCNVLAPKTLDYIADAIGASRTILLSMNKSWHGREGDFWVESPVNFLAALIWFLRKYQGGRYCTLPHAIELAQVPYDKLFTLLNAEPEIQTLIGPFIEAYLNKTMEMLDGQLSSARIPLGRLASPDLYYVLTGDDVGLDINDPVAPKILCLGGDPPRQEALAPILSLYIDRLNKRVNQQGKYKCALVCDEFATVRAYSMTGVIATGRSNNIVPVIAVQDLSQLRTQYSRDEADLFLNIAGNLVCGQVGGETARWVSERFPGVVRYSKTVSVNSNDTSISRSEHTTRAVDAATIANLSSGEFVGVVADDPDTEVTFKTFHSKIIKEKQRPAKSAKIPIVREVDAAMIEANFQRIKREIEELVITETERIGGDGALKKKVVKR